MRRPDDRQRGSGSGSVLIAALALAIPLGGCSSFSGFSLPFFASSESEILVPEQAADKLYNEGLTLVQKRDFPAAAKKFEEVDRQHPYSEWARKSLLMAAYAYYEGQKYDESVVAAKRYVGLHPGSVDVAYAQYLMAASFFDQIPDVTRDQGRTEKAIAALDEVIRKYPTSEYAESAKRKLDVARDQLAGKEMMVGRYYLERRNFAGAINRFKAVVTQYQTTRHVEEALMRLAEAYMALGIVAEAQTAAAVLGHNFPQSPWYQDAFKLVQSGGAEPREDKGSWISRAFGNATVRSITSVVIGN
jgi:outer membrane protein assembly factor BamD